MKINRLLWLAPIMVGAWMTLAADTALAKVSPREAPPLFVFGLGPYVVLLASAPLALRTNTSGAAFYALGTH